MKKLVFIISVISICLFSTASQTVTPAVAAEKNTKKQAVLIYINDQIVQETATGKMWQVKRSSLFRSIEEAEAYIANLTVGAYSDWRLPTIMELYELHSIFDHKNNGDVTMKMEGSYWAHDDIMGVAGSWDMDTMCCDPSREYFKQRKGYVRAIRP